MVQWGECWIASMLRQGYAGRRRHDVPRNDDSHAQFIWRTLNSSLLTNYQKMGLART